MACVTSCSAIPTCIPVPNTIDRHANSGFETIILQLAQQHSLDFLGLRYVHHSSIRYEASNSRHNIRSAATLYSLALGPRCSALTASPNFCLNNFSASTQTRAVDL